MLLQRVDDMILKQGRCPFCGNFGKELDASIFHCPFCEAVFDTFFVFTESEKRVDWS